MANQKRFDEFYSNGKIELGRSGNFVSVKNKYTAEEIKNRNKIIASHIEEAKDEINELVNAIVEKIHRCDPLFLLLSATDVAMSSLIHVVSEIQIDQDSITNMRLIEYIQSILVAQPYDEFSIDEDTQSEMVMEIFADIENLFMKCQFFNLIWAAQAQEQGELKKEDIEYIVEAQLMSNVRGHRYQFQQLDDLEKLLAPHSDKLIEVYGETADSIIEGLRKLEISLSSGKLDSLNDFISDYEAFQRKAEGKTFDEVEALLEEKRQSHTVQDYLSKCFGTDLYDVKKVTNWDDRLIESLSWSIGENMDLFQKTEYPGWPIQDLPVQKRPFIKIKDIVYCFDYYNLFDNIYRVLQKNIKEHDPLYVTVWAQRQQDASESLVAEKFAHLLPNAKIYIGNYYPISGSLKQMDENDIFVICDDVVIIAEVKAGSFTYTPAITDYQAHKRSFADLIGKADYQCIRTQNYFTNNGGSVTFYNNDKTEKFVVDSKKIRRIYTVCVTVDNFNTFEAKIEKTNFFNSASGTIAISIDDLDVYEDYFDSEICFLHFLKHRKAATRIRNLTLNDELDHLGLYISQNSYEEYVNDFRDCNSFMANGFREELDAYYAGVHNSLIAKDKPTQVIPQYYREIFGYLEKNDIDGRTEFGEFILDFAYDERERLDESIRGRILREKQLGYMTPMWVEFDLFSYCCFVNIPDIESLSERHRKKYVYANMIDRKQNLCWYIFVNLDRNGHVNSIIARKVLSSQYVSDGFTTDEIHEYISEMKSRRKAHGTNMPFVHKRKVYPNELCPCGSGMKYKKCCGKNK